MPVRITACPWSRYPKLPLQKTKSGAPLQVCTKCTPQETEESEPVLQAPSVHTWSQADGPSWTLPLKFYKAVVFDGSDLLICSSCCTKLLARVGITFAVQVGLPNLWLLCFPAALCVEHSKKKGRESPACVMPHLSFIRQKCLPICAVQVFGTIMIINIAKRLEPGKVLSGRASPLSQVALGQWAVKGKWNISTFHNQHSSELLFQENN